MQKIVEPCVMVIFGATGDLTKRKLFPALYNLAKDKFLPENFAIVGVGRQELESEDFRRKIIADLKEFIPNGIDKNLLNGLRNDLLHGRRFRRR
jgi:glucose-6-phosphate 1-dehydrogenase